MTSAARSIFRHCLAKVALSLVSLLVTLGFLEIAVRIFMPQDLDFFNGRKIERIASAPPYLPENIPHGRNDSYIGVPVRIDGLGLRGEEVSVLKPPRTFRIIGVGDSITFGYGVRLEDTFLKLLEMRLNRAAVFGARYEVLNAGVEGTGLDYYDHFLSTVAPKLDPDMVIVNLCLNDIAVYSKSEAGHYQPTETQERLRGISDFLLEHSELYTACYRGFKSLLYRTGVLDINQTHRYDFLPLEPPSREQAKAWESSFQVLSHIVSLCRQRNYRLLLVVFPMEVQLSPALLQLYRDRFRVRLGPEALSGEPQSRIRQFGGERGITVVDLLPAFRAANSSELYLRNKAINFDPVHPSPFGNRIAAEELFRAITDNGLQLPANAVPSSPEETGTHPETTARQIRQPRTSKKGSKT